MTWRTRVNPAPTPAEAIKAVLNSASNSLAYWALSPAMRHVFSDDGRAVVAYRPVGGVSLAAGDPAGPVDARSGAFDSWVRATRRDRRIPVMYQATLEGMDLGSGWNAVPVGDEAIVELAEFSLAGKAHGNIRRSHKRALDEGWTLRFFHNLVDEPQLAEQADAISRAWMKAKGGSEMGFSMGPFKCETPDSWWALAVDAEGTVQVILSFVPNYGRRGWTLDVMRRAPEAPSHAMDFALVAAILHWQEQGAEILSLGLAPLSNHHQVGPRWWQRTMRAVASRNWGGYSCRSLEAYKSKFTERWEPRYLVYPRHRLLQAILASARAHQTVNLPALRRRGESAQAAPVSVAA